MLDYLIVGLGLAGSAFCDTLERNDKTFKVISDDKQVASTVAAGLINPIVLKRFTLAWKAKQQMAMALPFYADLGKKLGQTIKYPLPVLRRFASVEEQNLWFEASDKVGLSEFISPTIFQNENKNIDAPLGYGEVLQTARIDTNKMISSYKNYLLQKGGLLSQKFDFKKFGIEDGFVRYKTLRAKHIVFAEGFGLKTNHYFNYLPLKGNKGEYLFMKATDLGVESAIKANFFCIPEADDTYRIGATYDPNDKTPSPTRKNRKILLEKWESIYKCPYSVVGHTAGIRPTVIDRRPLVGKHPKLPNVYVLNGLGSRGVLIAPYASNILYSYIEDGKTIPAEMDITRFTNKYFQA